MYTIVDLVFLQALNFPHILKMLAENPFNKNIKAVSSVHVDSTWLFRNTMKKFKRIDFNLKALNLKAGLLLFRWFPSRSQGTDNTPR